MTRMMKIVPASRLVRDASPEPPSIDRSRAITPAGGAVVDGASVTVTVGNPERAPRGAATIRPINYSLRLGWVDRPGRRHSGACKARTRNLEIPRCAIAHLRFALTRAPE